MQHDYTSSWALKMPSTEIKVSLSYLIKKIYLINETVKILC